MRGAHVPLGFQRVESRTEYRKSQEFLMHDMEDSLSDIQEDGVKLWESGRHRPGVVVGLRDIGWRVTEIAKHFGVTTSHIYGMSKRAREEGLYFKSKEDAS